MKEELMNYRPQQKLDIMMCRPLSGMGLPRHPANGTWEGAWRGRVP